MFGNDERDRKISNLAHEVRELKARLWAIEDKCADYRVGEFPYSPYSLIYPQTDTRPSVTVHNAIKQIMDHLKLEFVATDAVPATVNLQRKAAR